MPVGKTSIHRVSALYGAIVVVALAAGVDLYVNLLQVPNPFWDFRTYFVALHAADIGLNPYSLRILKGIDPLVRFPFIYPPDILWFFRDIIAVTYKSVLRVYLFGLVISFAVIYSLQYALLFQRCERWILATALIATLGRVTFKAFLTGNIAIPIYGCLVLGLWALVRGRAAWFYGAILIASQFKFLFLSFLLVPLILSPAESFWPASMVVVVYGIETLAMRWTNPGLFANFLSADSTQFMYEFYHEHNGLFGLASYFVGSVFDISGAGPFAVGFAAALYGIFIATIVLTASCCVAPYRRVHTVPLAKEPLAYLWLSAALCFPRLGTYDLPALILPVACLIKLAIWRSPGALVASGLAMGLLIGLCLLNPGHLFTIYVINDPIYVLLFTFWALVSYQMQSRYRFHADLP